MKEMFMNKDQREIHRKLRILRHAEETGHVQRHAAILVLVKIVLSLAGSLSKAWRRWAHKSSTDPQMACQQNTHRDRGEGSLSTQELSPRPNVYCLVSGSLSRYQNIRRYSLSDAQTPWNQPFAARYSLAKDSYETLQ